VSDVCVFVSEVCVFVFDVCVFGSDARVFVDCDSAGLLVPMRLV